MKLLFESIEMSLFSDYGSGSSSGSSSSWLLREKQTPLPSRPKSEHFDSHYGSYLDLMMSQYTAEDKRREFQLNGSDSPYNPDEDAVWRRQPGELSGMGPSAQYLRQKSWPAPERSPAARLPRPHSLTEPRWELHFATSTPIEDDPPAPFVPDVPPSEVYSEQLTSEQMQVLNSLPDAVLYPLLKKLKTNRRNQVPLECRFCKNNGERMSFYRSHALKDQFGRVSCPVLRDFTCRRCGARGDNAHTIKYCPSTTNEERIQSAGMMRSVRMASGRRRHSAAPSASDVQDYIMFGEPTPSVLEDTNALNGELDPLWAALERKLLL